MPKKPTKARPTDPLVNEYPAAPAVARARIEALQEKIHINDPAVAVHVARVILKHNFDFIAAVSFMLPKINAADGKMIAYWLSEAPQIVEMLNALYKTMGMDDAAFQTYRAILWQWLTTGTTRQKADAAKIMAQMFGVSDKAAEANKPTDLPLKDLGAGLARMGLGDDVIERAKTNPTGYGKIEPVEDDE